MVAGSGGRAWAGGETRSELTFCRRPTCAHGEWAVVDTATSGASPARNDKRGTRKRHPTAKCRVPPGSPHDMLSCAQPHACLLRCGVSSRLVLVALCGCVISLRYSSLVLALCQVCLRYFLGMFSKCLECKYSSTAARVVTQIGPTFLALSRPFLT
jgi:hypothetical protein